MSMIKEKKQFLQEASSKVLESVHNLMNLDSEDISGYYKTEFAQTMKPHVAEQVSKLLVQPVREITDRGGKGWRSHIMVTMCEALGGDPSVLAPWTGVIELLHVGSLIIDDIEDNSELRRGKKSCHLLYGLPLALNAGSNAYFMIDRMVEELPVSDKAKLKIYKLFFEVMRLAHAGQALDINGVEEIALEMVEKGAFCELKDMLIEINRLKTGMPVTLCLLIGAIAANANEEQLSAITEFGETVGIAFQIGDDIVNLKGFDDQLKVRGEDIINGKITFPIAVALEKIPEEDAKSLVRLILEKNNSGERLTQVLKTLDETSALEISSTLSKQMLFKSWSRLNKLIPENEAKQRLLEFGKLFIEKHY